MTQLIIRLALALGLIGALSACATYPNYHRNYDGYGNYSVSQGPGYYDGGYSDGGYYDRGYSDYRGSYFGYSDWSAPYRYGYSAYGFRDPWYGGSSYGNSWQNPWNQYGRSRSSNWGWSLGYGWSSNQRFGNFGYGRSYGYNDPWRWSSPTWHRPYYGYRPLPQERRVDWRPADGVGVASSRFDRAEDQAQRIANRRGAGSFGSARGENLYGGEPIKRADDGSTSGQPLFDQRGRALPRGARSGWVEPVPQSTSRFERGGLIAEQPQRLDREPFEGDPTRMPQRTPDRADDGRWQQPVQPSESLPNRRFERLPDSAPRSQFERGGDVSPQPQVFERSQPRDEPVGRDSRESFARPAQRMQPRDQWQDASHVDRQVSGFERAAPVPIERPPVERFEAPSQRANPPFAEPRPERSAPEESEREPSSRRLQRESFDEQPLN